MKNTIDQIKAFELAKEKIPELQMKIAGVGSGRYYNKAMRLIEESIYSKDIEYLGKVSKEEKINLMQKCHLIMVTSIKEGWGLIVTEANSQGTPAIVYNVDGLCDSVRNNKTGFISKENNPECLAQNIVQLCHDKKLYSQFQTTALKWSKTLTFDKMYKEFMKLLHI
jgi:glycosyltransferase involved in cell wall biosynthesis